MRIFVADKTNNKMKKQKDSGWRDSYHVTNSRWCRYGVMKCAVCQKNIQGNYLVHDRTNIFHRGNETDEVYLYHRNCSPVKSPWVEFDEKARKDKKDAKDFAKRKLSALTYLAENGLTVEDLIDND